MDYFFLPAMEAAAGCAAPPLHIVQRGSILFKISEEECRRNGSNLFKITADAHPGVSGVSNDQKFCKEFKNTHCQVNHPAKIE